MVRIFSIFHLCLLFTLGLYGLSFPFLNEHYQLQKKQNLYEFILGRSPHQNHDRFLSLEEEKQKKIWTGYQDILFLQSRPFSLKFFTHLKHLISFSLLFFLVWWVLSFSLALSFLKEKARPSFLFFLLPLLAFFYGFTNERLPQKLNRQIDPFPSESFLLQSYPPPFDHWNSFQKLSFSFDQYLFDKWTKKGTSPQEKREDGLFWFYLAQVEGIRGEKASLIRKEEFQTRYQTSLFLRFLLFLYSLFFPIFFLNKKKYGNSYKESDRSRDSAFL